MMKAQLVHLASAFGLLASIASAQFQSGDVFREYYWRPPSGLWSRTTGPDASMAGAKAFLPNPVNSISIDDLQNATRVEVVIEKLTSHAGTMNPRMRVNGNAWIGIPEPDSNLVPGTRGSGGPTQMYLCMRYPVVSVPLAQLKQGTNSFEFTCEGAGGQDIGKVWPQWIYYGVTFRVYYSGAKGGPQGRITSPGLAALLGDNPTIEVEANSPNGIQQVDVIGDYDDFDWCGDGRDRQWQFNTLYGKVGNHMGTATAAPYRVTWDTSWIPTQHAPFSVMARIVDKAGLIYVTPAVSKLMLARTKTVVRYRNTSIPQKWQSLKYLQDHSCASYIQDDLSRAEAARMTLCTWNGYYAEGIGVNSRQLRYNIGGDHNLSYDTIDVPLGYLVRGKNTIYTHSSTEHHGIEVQWPGPEIFVRYSTPEVRASYTTFGAGCVGPSGRPFLAATDGRPALGQRFNIEVWYWRANAPFTLITGASKKAWGPLPLPLPLATIGAPGCDLLVSPDVLDSRISDGNSWAAIKVQIPNDASLSGFRFYSQVAFYDAGANPLKLLFSNGGEAFISDF